jgi:hypothetical protein
MDDRYPYSFLKGRGNYRYYFFVFFVKKKKATRSKFATVSDRHSPTSSCQCHASAAVGRTAETLNIKYSNTESAAIRNAMQKHVMQKGKKALSLCLAVSPSSLAF